MNNIAEKYYITILKNILKDMHDKSYEQISSYVNDSKCEDMLAFLKYDFEEALEANDYDAVDEFGVQADDMEENQLEVYEFDDGSGFTIDYLLTSDGEETGFVLQLDFLYQNEEKTKVKCFFNDIDLL